jgi:hypothetical protein
VGDKTKAGTVKLLRENFDIGSGILLAISIVSGVVFATLWSSHGLSNILTGWAVVLVAVFLLGSFFRPVLAMARKGYDSVFSVCVVGGFLIICGLTAFYLSYYLINANLSAQGSSLAKLLDLPPLIFALWAAVTGWYVHFQLTCRNHRVSHAVTLVISRSTNAELRRRLDMLRKYLPTKDHIDQLDKSFYGPAAMEKAKAEYDVESVECVRNMRLTQSVDALKYLLNYYEFMAVAIELGDLEESIVYETMSPHVVGLYERSSSFIAYVRSNEGLREPLAFEHLSKLVDRWAKQLKAESA